MKKQVIVMALFIVTVFLVSGCMDGTQPAPEGEGIDTSDEMTYEYTDVSAAEAKQLIEDTPNLVIIDVSPHYDKGHLPGSIGYYPSSELQAAIPTLDAEATYLVYCHADGPSRSGAQALADAGLTVYRLESHFSGWQDAGYDIEM
jgi:rhodanese-related sulfurtransferase